MLRFLLLRLKYSLMFLNNLHYVLVIQYMFLADSLKLFN